MALENWAFKRVQTLADSGIQTVPPQYVRPVEKAHHDPNSFQVPIIDLQLPFSPEKHDQICKDQYDSIAAQISRASENWGFFQIINHGIPDSIIARVQAAGKAFFQLATEEKEAYANEAQNPIGYGSKIGYSPDSEAHLDWGDYYYNAIWPPGLRDMSKWPTKLSDFTYILVFFQNFDLCIPYFYGDAGEPKMSDEEFCGCRETMDEYSRELSKLFELLMEALSRDLGLDSENSLNESVGGERKELYIRMNYYPPCPQPDLVVGLAPHSDPNVLTILLNDQTPGLQIRKNGAWIDVHCVPGALVVNIADQMEILSNGKYKSIEHRGMVHKERSRMSWAVFCSPPRDVVVSPRTELIDKQHSPLYQGASYGEYLMKFFKKGLDGKGHIQDAKQQHSVVSKS
eukprot:PITA_14777